MFIVHDAWLSARIGTRHISYMTTLYKDVLKLPGSHASREVALLQQIGTWLENMAQPCLLVARGLLLQQARAELSSWS
jgi:hypothetical protein